MWEEFTYNSSTNEFSDYFRGTDYPASFSHEYFQALASGKEGWSVPTNTDEWSGFITGHSDFSAIMGGVGDLWSAILSNPATSYFLGEYDNWSGQPQLLGADIESYNVKNDTYTTLDEKGAYKGYIGGIEKDGAIEGGICAIYLNKINDTTSKAGILKGNFTGTAYQNIDMWWEGIGGMYPVYLMDVTIPPESLMDNIYTNYFDSNYASGGFFTLNNEPMGVGEGYSPFEAKGEYSAFYSEGAGSWGVWQSALGGVYGDPETMTGIAGLYPSTPSSDSWSASLEFIDFTRIIGQEVTGTEWSSTTNKIAGTTIGYGADTNIPATWVSVGEVKGTFDPIHYTFQAGSMGVAIETNTFLQMQGGATTTETANAALKALNIPAVQVGKTTLTQASGTVNNL